MAALAELFKFLKLTPRQFDPLIAVIRSAVEKIRTEERNIILADEPTGSLDFENAKQIFKILFNLKNKNRIIIFATHNRYFANMADCKIKMIGGKMSVTNERIN